MTITAQQRETARFMKYVPGRGMAKLGLAVLGVALVLASMQKLGPLAKLAFLGGHVRGEAVAIVQVDPAGTEKTYTTDDAVADAAKVAKDSRDFRSVFWPVYRFTTEDGKQLDVRSPLGQHVPMGDRHKPIQPLRDQDGLPTAVTIWYDPANPKNIALPAEFGTWFMPGMLVLFGVIAIIMGLTLWRHANDEIEMPDLSRKPQETPAATSV